MGRPAVATRSCTADSLVCGDFSRVTVGIFGNDLEMQVNPYADFRAGIVEVRLMLMADLFVSPAAAFSVSSSIT